jgi:hypothetical protein
LRRGVGGSDLAILGCFVLAIFGTFLDWIDLDEGGINGWDCFCRFSVLFERPEPNIDALIIIAIAVVGSAVLLASESIKLRPMVSAWGVGLTGIALVVVGGVLIEDIQQFGHSAGIGLYMIVAAGVAAVILTFFRYRGAMQAVSAPTSRV